MAIITWRETLTQSTAFGPTIFVGTGRASCIPTPNRITLPGCYLYPGLTLKFLLTGSANTGPANAGGSIRFEICMGALGTTVVFDTLPMPLDNLLKISRQWRLDVELVCRTIGIDTATTFFSTATMQSEVLIGCPLNTAGGNTSLIVPATEPSVGGGIDSTVASSINVFCTLKGSNPNLQVFNYRVEALN